MANVLATQTLEDGQRNTILKLTGFLDADVAYGDVVIDPASFSSITTEGVTLAAGFRIKAIRYDISDGLIVNVFWDDDGTANTATLAFALYGRGKFPDPPYGSVKNNDAGASGKIYLTTSGFSMGTPSSYTLILELIKVAVLP